MNIVLRWKAQCGDLTVPKGEYMVGVSRDTSQIVLTGGGSDYKLVASKRPTRSKIKHVKLQFQPSLGAATWSLSISTPPNTEWVALLKMVGQDDGKDDEEDEKERERMRKILGLGSRRGY